MNTSDDVAIVYATHLTVEMWGSLSKDLKQKLVLEEGDYKQDDLLEEDYVFWEVQIGDKKFSFFHGFPGDNPRGVLLEGKDIVLLLWEGEGNTLKESDEVASFLEWYTSKTNRGCNYDLEEFRASVLEAR